MDGAKGSALEWALALLRAPGERHALRQKPLPAGMDRLLGIAAGVMPEAMGDAMRAFGESEGRIREAARFYSREVLFFAQADAYRTLGVARDAEIAQIKLHHRLLQHWLHPDRLQSEDDAVFAARVNTAWNQLRSEQKRAAYDETLQQSGSPDAVEGNGMRHQTPAWTPEMGDIVGNPAGWRHRLPVLALSIAAIVLTVLVVHDAERQPDIRFADADGQRDSDSNAEPLLVAPVADIVLPGSATKKPPASRAAINPIASVASSIENMPAMPMATPLTMHGDAASAIVSIKPSLPAIATPDRASESASSTMSLPQIPPVEEAPRMPADPPAQLAKAAPLPASARIDQARKVGDLLLRYLENAGRPPPPIWNSPAIQSSADQLRDDLHRRGNIRVAVPEWRVGTQAASLTSHYDVEGEDTSAGQLSADLVWRDGQWLVTGLSMERSR